MKSKPQMKHFPRGGAEIAAVHPLPPSSPSRPFPSLLSSPSCPSHPLHPSSSPFLLFTPPLCSLSPHSPDIVKGSTGSTRM